MEIDSDSGPRLGSFGVVVGGLLALAVGLGAMLVITIREASAMTDPAARKLLLRLAWLSLVLISLDLVMLLWCVLRHIRDRMEAEPPPKPSKYVNAWELAGQRIRLEDETDADEDPEVPGG
ncbi:MAG TPA: hypothetical protein VM695_08460 [Phycisphaerae bacterium]|nr:hypothetical protein [Phycisphaerae bacterium]